MASSSTAASNKSMAVERPSQEPLKCPRCDSSNTKFCYYNNYSLSQPRHFCKACKRYWTRGGTLRNVPVGGGCRKNNRVKRLPSNSAAGDAVSTGASAGNPSYLQPRVDLSHSLLYNNLSTSATMNPLEFSFPFSGLSTVPKFSPDDHSSALFDIQPRVEDAAAGLSAYSSIFNSNGFFGSSSTFDSSTSTAMTSLLASTIQYQQNYANSNLQGLMPYHEGKKGTQQNGSGWNSNQNPNPNSNLHHTSQIDNPSDHGSSDLLWNPSNVSSSVWFDPSNNMGSSVPSLI